MGGRKLNNKAIFSTITPTADKVLLQDKTKASIMYLFA